MRSIAVLLNLFVLASASWANAAPASHSVFKCTIDGDAKNALIFAYDQKGEMPEGQASKPGYCQLTVDANGNPYGGYFCWVADTQTAQTSDGQLAILFKQNLGSGAYLYTQINAPSKLPNLKAFNGSERTSSRAPKTLAFPLEPKSASKIDCTQQSLTFQDSK